MKNLFTISVIVSGLLNSNTEIARTKDLFIQNHKSEYNKIVSEQTLTKDISNKPAHLSIPVYLYVFNDYYKYYFSEYKYLDEYRYNDKILIFDKNTLSNSSHYKNNKWLENIEQTKQFTPQTSKGNGYDGYDPKHNINWIDGKSGPNVNLKNILSLRFPKKSKSSFSKHSKEMVLIHNHKHNKHINEYSGYWQNGQILDLNLFFQINYGKLPLESDIKPWFDVYKQNRSNPKTTPCSEIRKFNVTEIGFHNNFSIKEGFNSKCNQFSLSEKNFKFHRQNWQYSSGYASYKYVDTHWNTKNVYYYLLGDLYDTPNQTQDVNSSIHKDTLWYVDYDDVFAIDIERLNNVEKYVDFSIKINPSKINNVKDFLTISSVLKFKLSFQIDGEDRSVEFTLDEVFKKKTYKFNFFAVKNEILFQNPKIKLIQNHDLVVLANDKEYKVSNFFDNSASSTFNKLLFQMPQNHEFFYSEIKNKKRWHNFFYIQNEHELIRLDSSFLNKLNVKMRGSDAISKMSLTYYDFFKGQEIKVTIDKLLTLPVIRSDNLFKSNNHQNVTINKGEVISNDYFWENINLELQEKNIFEGIERYSVKSKNKDSSSRRAWNAFYHNKQLFWHTAPVIKTKPTVDETNISNNFYITEYGKKQGFIIEDFDFSIVANKPNYLTVLVKWNKFQKSSYKTIQINKIQDFSHPNTIPNKTKTSYIESSDDANKKNTFTRFQNKEKTQPVITSNITNHADHGYKNYPLIFSSVTIGSCTICGLGLKTIGFIKKTV